MMRFRKYLSLAAAVVLGCTSPELEPPAEEVATGKNQSAAIEPTTGANIFFITANLRRKATYELKAFHELSGFV
jgi:hypothetical protein